MGTGRCVKALSLCSDARALPSHVLAIDAGTTGVTALLLDRDRQVQARAYAEFTQIYPRPGWVEHDALEILATAESVAARALQHAGISPADVAVGITNQRETTVVWDGAGRPVHHALVWQDRRTADRCDALADHADEIRAKTGLVTDPYFCATKLEWILQHVDGAGAPGHRFGTIDAWLAWKWTGRHVTDPTNASRTMLWDIHRSRWDDDLLTLFGVPAHMLPEVVPSSSVVGDITSGPLAGATLAALVGDQQAALYGQGCTQAGQAKNTYGTGCFLLQHTGSEAVASSHGLLTTRAASLDEAPQYALEGSVFVGGAAIQWLRDGIKIIDSSPGVNDRASEGDDNGGVVVVPAFAGLGAPYWDAHARGAILGLTRGTTRRHIARATLESIAHQSRDLVEAMAADSGIALPALRVDGGAAASDLLMQAQADLLQVPVERPGDLETTALGAAALAAHAVGMGWSARDEQMTRFTPRLAPDDVAQRVARWHAAVAAVRSFG